MAASGPEQREESGPFASSFQATTGVCPHEEDGGGGRGDLMCACVWGGDLPLQVRLVFRLGGERVKQAKGIRAF